MRPNPLQSSPRWIQITAVVVIASVVVALAHLAWRLTDMNESSPRPGEANPSLDPAAGTGALGSILAIAPFGKAAEAQNIPATLLPLVLKGIVYSSDPATSFALISSEGGPGQTWSVGQVPADGAVIEAIEVDRVILGVSGRREALSFPSFSASGTAPAASMATGIAQPPADLQPGPAIPADGTVPETQAAAGGSQAGPGPVSGSSARSEVPPATSGTGAMLSAAGLSATTEGLRVGPDPSARLRRAGLQPGDLIRSLNGRPVADVASERQLIERAILAGSARVEVERDGMNLTLTIPLR